jgi:hypothetical protein
MLLKAHSSCLLGRIYPPLLLRTRLFQTCRLYIRDESKCTVVPRSSLRRRTTDTLRTCATAITKELSCTFFLIRVRRKGFEKSNPADSSRWATLQYNAGRMQSSTRCPFRAFSPSWGKTTRRLGNSAGSEALGFLSRRALGTTAFGPVLGRSRSRGCRSAHRRVIQPRLELARIYTRG